MRKFVTLALFTVPANATINLSPELAKLHAPRLLKAKKGFVTLEPIFLKPGTEFEWETDELPRTMAEVIEEVEVKGKGKGKQAPTPESGTDGTDGTEQE